MTLALNLYSKQTAHQDGRLAYTTLHFMLGLQ